jgi:hypothetical protein
MGVRTWWADGHPIFPGKWTHKNHESELTWIGKTLNVYYRRTLWLRPSYLGGYLLKRRDSTAWGSWLETVWCRAKGHEGEIYYNVGGLEPDHRCKGCGETVG